MPLNRYSANQTNCMKKISLIILACIVHFYASAQTNTFPLSGKVGIGTTSPSAKLHINTQADTTGLIIQGSSSQTNHLLDFKSSSGTVLSYADKDGRLHFVPPTNSGVDLVNIEMMRQSDNTIWGTRLGIDAGSSPFWDINGAGSLSIRDGSATRVKINQAGTGMYLYTTNGYGSLTIGNTDANQTTMSMRNLANDDGAAYFRVTAANYAVTGAATNDLVIYTPSKSTHIASTSSYPNLSVTPNGVGVFGVTSPTARLHIAAGTATANTAPLKLTTGTNLSTTEAGAIEYDGTHLYFTATNGGTRYQLDQQSGSSGWALGGNSGTSSSNFIGTTDAQNLALKTNNVQRLLISSSGNVGIGTSNPQAKLAVNGDIFSTKVKVTQSGWSDYVFEKDYKLPTLAEVEKYIQQHKHLPDVPSAEKAEKDGLDLGDNQSVLLKKIEELTLYVIDINKKVEKLSAENEALKKKIKTTDK